MASQKGILPFKGRIGTISFFESKKGGFSARQRKGIDPKRVANDPAFQRTRENGEEFGRACVAGRLLRSSLRSLLKNCRDGTLIARLVKEIMKVIHADQVSPRGSRNVIDGEAELLQGFEFNSNSPLSSVMLPVYTASIDRTSGTLSVTIPSFVPTDLVIAPPGSTHFRIVSAGVEIDFESKVYTMQQSATEQQPLDSAETAVIALNNSVTANSTHPLFLALGIQFYQKAGGQMYPFNNGAFNALSLVKVSGSQVTTTG